MYNTLMVQGKEDLLRKVLRYITIDIQKIEYKEDMVMV